VRSPSGGYGGYSRGASPAYGGYGGYRGAPSYGGSRGAPSNGGSRGAPSYGGGRAPVAVDTIQRRVAVDTPPVADTLPADTPAAADILAAEDIAEAIAKKLGDNKSLRKQQLEVNEVVVDEVKKQRREGRAKRHALSVVCRACTTAWRCKSSTQPDGGEGLVKRKGEITLAARRGLKEAWSKDTSRGTRTGYETYGDGRAGNGTTKPISIKCTGGKSGGCVSKAVELSSGDLRHVTES